MREYSEEGGILIGRQHGRSVINSNTEDALLLEPSEDRIASGLGLLESIRQSENTITYAPLDVEELTKALLGLGFRSGVEHIGLAWIKPTFNKKNWRINCRH